MQNQLKNVIGPLTYIEACEHLLQKIVCSYDKALACSYYTKIGYPGVQSPKDVFKKRKTLPRWSEQIRVCSGTGHEGPPDDGHSWRKYGQKDILGATHARAYYRCTHKPTRGCVATKQVQKMEEDPLIFEVTYRGKHTCMDVPNYPSQVVSPEEKPKDVIKNLQQQLEPKQKQKQNIPFRFGQGLDVETKEIIPKVVERIPSFSFSSTSIQTENQDICWEQFEEGHILAGLESPWTTESNYFSGSTSQVLPYPSDLTDMNSTPTSGTNSVFNLDMDPVEMNIERNSSFNILDYLIPDMIC